MMSGGVHDSFVGVVEEGADIGTAAAAAAAKKKE